MPAFSSQRSCAGRRDVGGHDGKARPPRPRMQIRHNTLRPSQALLILISHADADLMPRTAMMFMRRQKVALQMPE